MVWSLWKEAKMPTLYKQVRTGDYLHLSQVIAKEVAKGIKHDPEQIIKWSKEAESWNQYKACAHILIEGQCTKAKYFPSSRLMNLVEISAKYLINPGDHGVLRFIRILCNRLSYIPAGSRAAKEMIETLAESMTFIASNEIAHYDGDDFWTKLLRENIQILLSERHKQDFNTAYAKRLWKKCEKLMDVVHAVESS